MSSIKASKVKDIEFGEFYKKFFESTEWPFKSLLVSKNLTDLSFTDLALLVTTDGDLYGINRDNGKINWVLRGLNFVIKSERDLAKIDNQFDYKQHISNNVDFLWFLEPVGDGSIYAFDFRIGVYKLPFNIKQLVKLSPYSFPGDDKVYIGKKETSLFVIDVNTGEVYQNFSSGYQHDGYTRCFFAGFGRYYDKECNVVDIHNKNVLKIGRIDYILSVYSGSRLLWNVSYSEWVPSFINVNFENRYNSMFDGKYILSTHNGRIFQHNITGLTSSVVWSEKLDNPVTKVFDILSFVPISIHHLSETNKQNIFIMMEQPTDFVFKTLNKTYNRYVFINVTKIDNWYALSEEKFPFIKEASLSRWYDSTINFGKLGIPPLYTDLIGLHRISYDTSQILTIDSSFEPLKISNFLDYNYGLKYEYILFIFLGCGLLIYFLWKRKKQCCSLIFLLKIKIFTWMIYMKKGNSRLSLTNILNIFNKKNNREYTNFKNKLIDTLSNTEDILLLNEIEDLKTFHLKKRRKGIRRNKKRKKGIENMNYINIVEISEDEDFEENQTEYNNDSLQDLGLDLMLKEYDSVEDIKFPLIINSLEITNKILGYGSHGTIVYEGSFEGRKVAVKRMLLEFYEVAFREITLLQESDGHPNVIRYYCKQKSDKFLYIALELCCASLYDIVERSSEFLWLSKLINVSNILYQIALGIQYLHSLKIVHRDIKPQNILLVPLYSKSDNNKNSKRIDNIRIVISDFGLCKKLGLDQSSFKMTTSQLSGTIGWRAPELFYEKDNIGDEFQKNIPHFQAKSVNFFRNHKVGRAIDIFSMGCVFYYVLTKGMHPFGEYYFREGNIVKGSANYSHLDFLGNESFLAKDLISKMLSLDPSTRPDANFVVRHPYFWSPEKKLSFLIDTSDRFETERRQPFSELLHFLEKDVLNIIGRNWQKKINKHILENSGKFRKYDGTKLLDLLRILRNKKNHYQNLPFNVQEILGPPPDLYLSYFMTRFPHLLLHCYYIVKRFLDKENMHQLASYF
ncbi:bifunctional endoribonuclease/protein kinase IRE1 [Pneumocystis jirovecii RU7]|uniref:non-specific serine/threonine protein kinase n=1 Tax=Pneumocystis jirovecii (strain RU7) TaxID=1408657 RepID=A0A0W4ZUH0_PNEJ7|nr:bifunctional endoribonuclease/protein kinase IRE1 [Pneumocystis jirovecii RU7]KTW32029.1 hypothetical protein T551_00711 [Pneumocystis jirovecii RU7]